MIRTKFTGVYYGDLQNCDRIFLITCKLNGKFKKEKIDTLKEGITVIYASKIRAKRTSIDNRLKEDAPMFLNQKLSTFNKCFDMY